MSCSRHDVRLDAKGQFWSNVSTSTCRCSGIDVSSNSSSSSTLPVVLAGSPSRRGDVAVYVFDINQASLPTPSYSVLVYFSLYGSFNCTSFHKCFLQLSAFSLCSSGLISALLVLSAVYHFTGLKTPTN